MDQHNVLPNAFFGKYLLQQNIITQEALDDALRHQHEVNRRIGDHAVQKGYLTHDQMMEVLEEQKNLDEPFGAIAIQRGYLSQDQLDDLLFSQIVNSTYLGEALLELGHITPDQFSESLREYTRMENRRRVEIATALEHYEHNEIIGAGLRALIRGFMRFTGEELKLESVCDERNCGDFDVRFNLQLDIEDNGRLLCSIFFPNSLAQTIAADFPDDDGASCDDACMRQCGYFFLYVERYFISGLEELAIPVQNSLLAGVRRGGPISKQPNDAVIYMTTTKAVVGMRFSMLTAI